MDDKERLRLAKEALDSGSYDKETIKYIFPELREESEDDGIRQLLLRFVKYDMSDNYSDDFSKEDCLAWLEKQAEQKSFARYKVGDTIYYNSFGRLVNIVIANIVEDGTDNPMYEDKDGNYVFQDEIVEQKPAWSEEDEENLNWFEKFFRAESVFVEGKDIPQDRYLWFKNLKDRVQPKQEWSEEEKESLELLVNYISSLADVMPYNITIPPYNDRKRMLNFLKSIRPQNTWKPNDEQMKLLREVQQALLGKDCHNRFVNFMYELKQLKEK